MNFILPHSFELDLPGIPLLSTLELLLFGHSNRCIRVNVLIMGNHLGRIYLNCHEILYTASGSRELRHVLSDFHHYAQRVRKITLSDKNRAVDSNNEHRRIVEALKQHDAQLAEKLANQHIMKTIENMDHYGWDNLLKK